MPTLPSNIDLLKHEIKAPLGGGDLPQEVDVHDSDIALALLDYFKYSPIKVTKSYPMWGQREIEIDIASLYPDTTSGYFYTGVMHFEHRSQLGLTRFDEMLLGFQNVPLTRVTPERQLMDNTVLDMATGDTYYEEDLPANKVRFVVGGSCILSVIFGLGIYDLEKVPLRHLKLVSAITGIKYYERILALRKTGKFTNTDFQLDTSLLESKLKEYQDLVKEQIQWINMGALTKG